MVKATEPEYVCAKCGMIVRAEDEKCPSCGTNLPGHRLIKLSVGGELGLSGSLSTAIYAPPGVQLSKEDFGLLKKAVRAIWTEMKKWNVEGANIGIPPVVVRLKR